MKTISRGWSPGTGVIRISAGDCQVQPELRTTGLGQREKTKKVLGEAGEERGMTEHRKGGMARRRGAPAARRGPDLRLSRISGAGSGSCDEQTRPRAPAAAPW